MKERPILFSGPMVRAILDGRKTQTRRVVKLPPHIKHHELDLTRMQDGYPDGVRPIWGDDEEPNLFSTRNPFGKPGDHLWLKETWRQYSRSECACYDDCQCPPSGTVFYRADHDEEIKWRPSIFMPRWASRITLEITGVRVERLQEISEEDAKKEGIESEGGDPKMWKSYNPKLGWLSVDDPAMSYRTLWESINGPGSWDANPWVWVIEFRRVEK